MSEQGNERAIVTIPEGITKIRIVDGTRGDVLTIDEESVAEFFAKINSVPGTVVICRRRSWLSIRGALLQGR